MLSPSDEQEPPHLVNAPTDKSWTMKEQAGTCFSASGDARDKWKHGRPRLAEGCRISISWRFYKELPKGAKPAVPPRHVPQQRPPQILVLSLCDGIGAVLQAAMKKWGPAARFHAWEITPEAIKVCSARAPSAPQHGDLRHLSDEELKEILEEYEFLAILVAACFPCQDSQV